MKHLNSITIAIAIALMGFTSCSDNDDNSITPPKEQNKYATKIDLSKSYLLTKPVPAFENETFHALGYGYDITGKYAHPDGIRKKVIDPQKFEDDHYYDVTHHRRLFYHRGLGTKTGTKDEVKARLLNDMKIGASNISTEYKNAFKGVFDSPFDNDTTYTDIKYYYAVDAFVSTWYEHYFGLFKNEDLLPLRDYLTAEFKSDLELKSAEEIIKLYGTHVMVDIEVGWRQDFYYRSSSNEDLQRRMVYTSGQFVNSTPGIWMSPDTNPYHEKENLYAEYVSGVDPIGKPNAWLFDITNYDGTVKFDAREHAIEDESVVLVNWGSRSYLGPIIPIYEFISDTAKREAIEQTFKEYLSK